jgi:hypothetical protein
MTITVDDKKFSVWPYSAGEGTIDPNTVFVTPISSAGDPNPDNPGPGLYWSSNCVLVGPSQILWGSIYFTVTPTDPTVLIKDNSLRLSSHGYSCDGYVGIQELVFNFQNDFGPVGKTVYAYSSGERLSDTLTFDPQPYLGVQNSFYRSGGVNGTASLTAFEQRFSQTVVPLPAAVWLLGAGFLGYLGLGRRGQNGGVA